MFGRLGRGYRGGLLLDVFLLALLVVLAVVFMRRHNAGSGTAPSKVKLLHELSGHDGHHHHAHGQFSENVQDNDGGIGEEIDENSNKMLPRSQASHEMTPRIGVAKQRATQTSVAAREQIDERIKNIGDVRSTACRRKQYNDLKQKGCTLIIDFYDYQLYDLKNTIGSVLATTNMDLINEIIIVDDGSTLEYIIEDVNKYVKTVPKARLIRASSSGGTGSLPIGTPTARTVAMRAAKTDILVFLDVTTVCTVGWLEPLLEQLQDDPTAFVVPHFDRIVNPVSFDFEHTPAKLGATLTWTLTIRMRDLRKSKTVSATADTSYQESPTLRGNLFAVSREAFNSIGGFDDGFEELGGGENLELSLRAWICGASIRVIPCSHVGVVNLYDPVKVTTHRNMRRIADLWFGPRKEIVYRATGLSLTTQSTPEEQALIAGRIKNLPQQCRERDIDWYLKNVASDLVTPINADATHFGILRVKSGRCARVGTDSRLDLDPCTNELFNSPPKSSMFELTKAGRVVTGDGRCLSADGSAYIVATECAKQADAKQRWMLVNNELANEWSSYCAMHVTDPDKKVSDGRQIAMAQDCASDKTPEKTFKSWEFVRP